MKHRRESRNSPKLVSKISFWSFVKIVGCVLMLTVGGFACSNDSGPDLLTFASIVAIDSSQNRLFAIDNQSNGLNLINTVNNTVVNPGDDPEQSLLSQDDPQLLPNFPSNAAVVDLGGGVSRLFVIGGTPGANNLITVLDYDTVLGLNSAPISPIAVAGSATDLLVGIAVDAQAGLVFVTNSSTGMLHAYDINTGIENVNSPLEIGGIPGRIKLDLNLHVLAISNAGNTKVSFVDTLDLIQPIATFDVGGMTRDVALATNASGTVLFISGSPNSLAQAYLLNLSNLPASTLLYTLSPPLPTDPFPDPNLLTGNLNQVYAGNLTNGQMAAFYTQSSGDLLALDLSSNLVSVTPSIVVVGAASGEGIDALLNSSNQILTIYYASPGVGAVTVVDPLTNQFTAQIQ